MVLLQLAFEFLLRALFLVKDTVKLEAHLLLPGFMLARYYVYSHFQIFDLLKKISLYYGQNSENGITHPGNTGDSHFLSMSVTTEFGLACED